MDIKKLALIAGLTFCVSQVFAANYADEYSKQIKSAEVVGALGPDMFGDQTSFYTGATSFETTDVSLPGNFALPVSVTRRYRVEMIGELGYHTQGVFGNWDLSIPHLEGIFRASWESGSGTATRCSDTSVPPVKTYQSTSFGGNEYWSGNSLVLPGGSSQEMLRVIAENPNKPSTGGPHVWVTNNNWYF